jgi:hypothetical protein
MRLPALASMHSKDICSTSGTRCAHALAGVGFGVQQGAFVARRARSEQRVSIPGRFNALKASASNCRTARVIVVKKQHNFTYCVISV